MIPENILYKYPINTKHYEKDQLIFDEGEHPHFYFQIQEGEIKMCNLTEDGKEFVQGYFKDGQSFGEPPLVGGFAYPACAIATKETTIHTLSKNNFFALLKENPEVHLNFTAQLCHRIHYKAMIVKEVSVHPPEHRILTLLHHLKTEANVSDTYEVRLTRQQISELTGLRVETVIRAIKKLEKNNKLAIINRKVFV